MVRLADMPRDEEVQSSSGYPGRLFLWFPVGLALKKVCRYLRRLDSAFTTTPTSALAVDAPNGYPEELLLDLVELLTDDESADTRCIFKTGTDDLDVDDIRRVRTIGEIRLYYDRPGTHGVVVSLNAINLLAALDRAIPGRRTRGWGEQVVPDETLLIVRGFDPVRGAFRYAVNPAFGAARRDAPSAPFSLQLRVRVPVGRDPARPIVAAKPVVEFTGGPVDEMRATLQAAIANTPARVLALYESRSLQLTAADVIALTLAMDSLQARIDMNVAALAPALLDDSPEGRAESARLRRRALVAEAQLLIDRGVEIARRIFGPGRWEELPEQVRQPPRDIPLGILRRSTSAPPTLR